MNWVESFVGVSPDQTHPLRDSQAKQNHTRWWFYIPPKTIKHFIEDEDLKQEFKQVLRIMRESLDRIILHPQEEIEKLAERVLLNDPIEEEEESDFELGVELACELLFGLIHRRFIDEVDVKTILSKWNAKEWGICPNPKCGECGLVPFGYDKPLNQCLEIVCPSCGYLLDNEEIQAIDGFFFGNRIHTEVRKYYTTHPVTLTQT